MTERTLRDRRKNGGSHLLARVLGAGEDSYIVLRDQTDAYIDEISDSVAEAMATKLLRDDIASKARLYRTHSLRMSVVLSVLIALALAIPIVDVLGLLTPAIHTLQEALGFERGSAIPMAALEGAVVSASAYCVSYYWRTKERHAYAERLMRELLFGADRLAERITKVAMASSVKDGGRHVAVPGMEAVDDTNPEESPPSQS